MRWASNPSVCPKGGTIPSYLSKYRDAKYTNVGSLTEPNLEAVYSLRPDLIIISGRQQTYYEELSQIAPTIYVALDTTDYMESFKANARLLGRIFGREDEVEEHLAAVERSVAEVQQKVKAAGYTALVVLVNDKSVSAFGPGSRFRADPRRIRLRPGARRHRRFKATARPSPSSLSWLRTRTTCSWWTGAR